MRFVGLDLSLTSTGVVEIDTDDVDEVARVRTVGSKGRADASLYDRGARLDRLRDHIVALALDESGCRPPALVAVESPSIQRAAGSTHDRSGLWWLVVRDLHAAGVLVAEVAPSARAKYATGKGNAGKDAVLAAVVRRYPDVPVDGNDTADALVLAAMAARALDRPIDDLPKTHLDAMTKVRWPHTEGEP